MVKPFLLLKKEQAIIQIVPIRAWRYASMQLASSWQASRDKSKTRKSAKLGSETMLNSEVKHCQTRK